MLTGCGAHLTATLDAWKPHGDPRAASRQARARGIERFRDRYVRFSVETLDGISLWRSARAGKDLAFSRPRSLNGKERTRRGRLGEAGGGYATFDPALSAGNLAAAGELGARARNPWNFMIRAEERSSIPQPRVLPSPRPHPLQPTAEFTF